MSQKRVLSVLLVALIVGLAAASPAPVVIDNLSASHEFGESVTFQGTIADSEGIESAQLTFKLTTLENSFVIPAEIQEDGLIEAVYTIQPQDRITAFSTIEFWFTLETDAGQVESEITSYLYTDNRYSWQSTSEGDGITANWIEGDLAFGQSVLDAAHQTESDFSIYLDLPYPETLDIYVYPTSSALQSALEISNTSWVAGHADTAGKLILLAIPTGFDQQLDIQRDVPHEVTHIRLDLYLGDASGSLPAWFSEGAASLSERYAAPEYWPVLQSAYKNDTLITMEELCPAFPSQADQAVLAYAEADSFLHFIFDRYGKVGLQNLLNVYQHGYPCVGGVEEALGTPLDELESIWKAETFRSAPIPPSTSSFILWVVLGLVVLAAPFALSLRSIRRAGKGSEDED